MLPCAHKVALYNQNISIPTNRLPHLLYNPDIQVLKVVALKCGVEGSEVVALGSSPAHAPASAPSASSGSSIDASVARSLSPARQGSAASATPVGCTEIQACVTTPFMWVHQGVIAALIP